MAFEASCSKRSSAGTQQAQHLLLLEGESGKGFSSWLPHLPGVYPGGDSASQVKRLAQTAAKYQLQDLAAANKPLPPPVKRTLRQIDKLLTAESSEVRLQAVTVTVQLPTVA